MDCSHFHLSANFIGCWPQTICIFLLINRNNKNIRIIKPHQRIQFRQHKQQFFFLFVFCFWLLIFVHMATFGTSVLQSTSLDVAAQYFVIYFCEPFSSAVKFVFVCMRLECFVLLLFSFALAVILARNYGLKPFYLVAWSSKQTRRNYHGVRTIYAMAMRTTRPQFTPK